MSADDPVEMTGTVARIVFSNPDTQYSVIRMTPDEGGEVTVVGTLAGVQEGERLRVVGVWDRHSQYGKQLRAQRYQVDLPQTIEGIKRYLSSGVIPGIGPKTAKLLVQRFGKDTLNVIDKNPERLRAVRGVGKKKIAQIIRSWNEHHSLHRAMVYLQGLGITPRLAMKLRQQYGDDAVGVIRSDPYRLIDDVHGIGFKRADGIAGQAGIGPDNPRRLQAGLLHTLQEARKEGHVCLPREVLGEHAGRLLGLDPVQVLGELDALTDAGRVILDEGDLAYSPDLHRAEVRAAEAVARLLDAGRAGLPDEPLGLAIRQAEGALGVELADQQRAAVRMVLTQPVSVVTGGPGTGKTTIVRAIVRALESQGEKVALCAPTGRAAKRLSASTDREAKTIHRLLEWAPGDGGFTRSEERPLETDTVIVDEASMVDIKLFDSLVRAIPHGGRLVLVGDVDQLPSVGPGAVLQSVIESRVVPVTALTEIFRQGEGSLIVANAHRLLAGELPLNPPGGKTDADFYWIDQKDPEQIVGIMTRLLAERIPQRFDLDPVLDVQVLTPMHRGGLGSDGLNHTIGHLLNPGRGDARLAPGDKVMQIRNNYDKEVYNGDVGFVERAADDNTTLLVRYDDPETRIVPYELQEQDQLVLAWAISIHKSQGSEYPAVVVPLHTQHHVMLRRNLVYTAVTRGRRLVVLIGPAQALRTALRAATVTPRHGRLADRLRAQAR